MEIVKRRFPSLNSRKLALAYVTIFLITAGFVATGFIPALAVTYAEFTLSLLAGAGLYGGSNVLGKYLGGRGSNPPPPPPPHQPSRPFVQDEDEPG